MADKYYVQERKSVTSLQGIKSPGDEVTEKMFKGGEKSIKGLIAKEIIGTKKPDLRTKAELVKEREEKKKKKAAAPAEKAGGAEKK